MTRNIFDELCPNGTAEPNGPDAPARREAVSDASDLVGDGLVLSYPSAEEPVVDDASIVAEPGAVTALVGPNGSGRDSRTSSRRTTDRS